MKNRHSIFTTILFALACFAPSPPHAFGVVPPPDGGYPNRNTAEGDDALLSLTTGVNNTAMGFNALYSNTTGLGNTAMGHVALYSNTTGRANTACGSQALRDSGNADANTAVGAAALSDDTTGYQNTATGALALTANTEGYWNVANGYLALLENATGWANTAVGVEALASNTDGFFNTAGGTFALASNTDGFFNTAGGTFALASNTIGTRNTASGVQTLVSNTTGSRNTATGFEALFENTTGNHNAALGWIALFNNTTGNFNIALGDGAGDNLTTGDNNIDIGNEGVAGESSTIRVGTEGNQTATYIAGIYQANIANGLVVKVDSTGHLGTVGSSERFKDRIKPMDKASEAILALKPVTFRYKKELDPEGIPQFGLVAEDVEKVNPDLVARDAQGKVYTVRYEAVNAMLLNEFLKEHRRVEEQGCEMQEEKSTVNQLKITVARQDAIIAQQQKEMETVVTRLKEQDSKIQNVSAQIEIATRRIRRGGPAPRLVLNP